MRSGGFRPQYDHVRDVMPLSLGKNAVSAVAIIALMLLGGGWAWVGALTDPTIQLFIIAGIAGLGGYSIKRSDVLPADARKQE